MTKETYSRILTIYAWTAPLALLAFVALSVGLRMLLEGGSARFPEAGTLFSVTWMYAVPLSLAAGASGTRDVFRAFLSRLVVAELLLALTFAVLSTLGGGSVGGAVAFALMALIVGGFGAAVGFVRWKRGRR